MKTTLPFLLLLSATLGFAEPAAPGGASSPSEPPTPPAETATAAPAVEASAPSEAPAPPVEAAAPADKTSAPGEPPAPPAETAAAAPAVEANAPSARRTPPAESAAPAAAAPGGASSPSEPPAAKPRREASLPSRVTLSDGSILKGTLRRRFLPADTETLGRIRIDLRAVESIVSLPASGDTPAGLDRRNRLDRPGPQAAQVKQVQSVQPVHVYRVAFKNGDRLTVRFPADMKPLPFDTVIGRVFLPLPAVSRLVLEPPTQPPNRPTTQPPNLIYHCTFDDAQSIERPVAGPAGKLLRGSFVPGKNGKALRVETDTPAFESMLPKGFLGPEGCLEFWAKIEGDDPRYVDGGDPLFVSLYDERGAITLLQFAANNGFARGGLGGAFVSWPFGTIPHYSWSMEYRKVLGENWADWHHYAMSWKAGGFGDGSFAKVFVDGKPQPVLGGVDDDKLPARLADYANHAHELGIPWSSARAADRRRSKKPFLVDDLRIWSVAKTDFATSTPSAEPRLLYHCTFDDATAIERPAVGPAGKFLGGQFIPGKKGNALLVKAGTPAAEVPFPTGLMQSQGCIEFWGKIPGATKDATFPDGGNPQFFAMGVGKWVNTFVKYTSNDGFGTGGLHADLPGSAYVSTLPSWSGSARYPDFLGDPSAWHHYALVWSDQGLDAASEALGRRVVSALYVDGKLVNPAYGTNGPDRAKFLSEFVDNPVVLHFPVVPGRQPEWQNRVDYLIDDFKIWNFPKADRAPSAPRGEPRLVYHCTFDDAAAIERPAAGPDGKFLGGDFVPGKTGNALRVYADTPAAQTAFKPGDLGTRGTIEFWAKMEDATPETVFGDGGNPRFFCFWLQQDIGRAGHNPRSTYLQWSGNDGGGRSGLCAMLPGATATTESGCGFRKYPDFLGNPAAWHHYAIVWDESGVAGSDSVIALYVDGKRLDTDGRDDISHGSGFRRFLETSVLLGFPQRENEREPAARHVPFLIDEFKIWSGPKVPCGEP
jgi:hypothetical protein